MKNRENNPAQASALQITLAVTLISISAILLASTFKAASPNTDTAEGPVPVASLNLPDTTIAESASLVSVPVMVSEINPTVNGHLQAFQGDFTFDSSVVGFQSGFVEIAGLTTVGSWALAANVLGTDTIKTLRVSCFTLDNTTLDSAGKGSQPLFNLKLVRANSATRAKRTPLVWAAPPNGFIFFDKDGKSRPPANTPAGSVTASGKRK